MDFPLTIESQEEFDGYVKERLARERARHADYNDLKRELAELRGKSETDGDALAKAIARAEAAEKQVSDYETAKQIDAWRAEVEAETGVSAKILRGSTREELIAHAEAIAPLLAPQNPAPQAPGKQPDAASPSAEAQFLTDLFSNE